MTSEEQQPLINLAKAARQNAYARYSNFPVGAALRTATGEAFVGCNVENASYGLTICAERVALTSAIAAGFRQFAALAIVTSGGVPPCGACLQLLSEFCHDLPLLLIDADQDVQPREVTLRELLPMPFCRQDVLQRPTAETDCASE